MDSKEGFDGKEAMTGFITEFRFFHQMQPVRPVSACAQALWHYLFYRANAAFWQFPLKIQANEIAGARTDLAVGVHALARGEPQRGLSALRA